MTGENNLVFREVQKFGLWFYLLAAFSNLAVIGVLCFLLLFRQNDIPSEATIPLLVVIIIILVVSTFFLLGIKLETEVRGEGLYVRFFPIHIRFKKFAAEDLDECYTRTYSPMREYGGWGIRFGKSGKAYNIKGDEGLQLVFKNGKRLLIGSQKSQELAQAVDSIMTRDD